MIKLFENFLLEKSIGSENTRVKWYSDIDKKLFYKIIKMDPTSIRKKDFSKLGKYSKWLIREYKKGAFRGFYENNYKGEVPMDGKLTWKGHTEKINYYLFIFSTGWFKRYSKNNNLSFDILTYSMEKFIETIYHIEEEFKRETEGAKYDYIYSDDNLKVILPLNYTASYEVAKNTDWCSKTIGSYNDWSQRAILYRIIFSDGEKIKITWEKDNMQCNIASLEYPEIRPNGNPFDKLKNGKERWEEHMIYNKIYNKVSGDHWEHLEKLIRRIPENVKKIIVDHFNHYSKKKNNKVVVS